MFSSITSSFINKIGKVDLVIGIPFFHEGDTIINVIENVTKGLSDFYPSKKSLIVCVGNPEDNINKNIINKIDSIQEKNNVIKICYLLPIKGKGFALNSILELSKNLNAIACAFIDADEKKITPVWPHLLVSPILEKNYDFVSSRYSRNFSTSATTNNFAYPLITAIYGKKIRQPIGGEFAVSRKLIQIFLRNSGVWYTDIGTYGIDNWLTSTAIVNNAKMCEVDLGTKDHNPLDIVKRSCLFKQVSKTLFSQIRENISFWINISNIEENEIFGLLKNEIPPDVPEFYSDYRKYVDKFKEIFNKNQDICKNLLPQNIYKNLKKINSKDSEEFDFSPENWADSVYSFLEAYLREANQKEEFWDSLLSLYLAQLGTHFKKAKNLSFEEIEKLVELQVSIFIKKRNDFISNIKSVKCLI
jgi:hypothetical protein